MYNLQQLTLRGDIPFKILRDIRKVSVPTDDNFFNFYHYYTKNLHGVNVLIPFSKTYKINTFN